jgi:hypothetical protein
LTAPAENADNRLKEGRQAGEFMNQYKTTALVLLIGHVWPSFFINHFLSAYFPCPHTLIPTFKAL